ncbi:hypothetical protein [Emcibacter sp.]|uniref:hypothetical protein n=1 Tax=Emcibacter sp. TaxID=1979954 RepID=UPI002AA6EE4F|nr:hypothetical protein [Emcibacter sp.]
MSDQDDLMELSAPELRVILEAGADLHGEEKISKARVAMQVHNKRVTDRWIKALGIKIVITLAIVTVLLGIYYLP